MIWKKNHNNQPYDAKILAISAHAASARTIDVYPSLAFNGTSATCTVTILGERTTDRISAVIAFHIADGFGAAVGANGGIAVADLIVVGVVGVICLPLDIGKSEGAAVVLDGLWEILGISIRQIGVVACGSYSLLAASVPGHLGFNGIQI